LLVQDWFSADDATAPNRHHHYVGELSHLLQLEPNKAYFAVVDANDGAGRVGRWTIPVIAKVRSF
jgi:hypothetical protein